jgi:hypothetical protein
VKLGQNCGGEFLRWRSMHGGFLSSVAEVGLMSQLEFEEIQGRMTSFGERIFSWE